MGAKGDEAFNRKLIEVVKKHDVLYDFNKAEYFDRCVVEREWQEAARELSGSIGRHYPAGLLRSKWTILRKCYVRAKKHEFTAQRRGFQNYKTTYYLKDSMEFLEPFIKLRTYYRKAEKTNSSNNRHPGLRKESTNMTFEQLLSPNAEVPFIKQEVDDDTDDHDVVVDSHIESFESDSCEYVNFGDNLETASKRIKVEQEEDGAPPMASNPVESEEQHQTLIPNHPSNENVSQRPEISSTAFEQSSSVREAYLDFFRSILPDIAPFSQQQSLKFKRNVLELIENIAFGGGT